MVLISFTLFLIKILPFITSGTHIIQKDCHPSAVNTFVESLSRCNPPIQIAPALMKYVGKSHNLWHRMALGLEQMASDPTIIFKSNNPAACYDFEPDQSLKSYVGKSHNLWHRMALGLEQMASDPTIIFKSNNPAACYDFEPDQSLKSEVLDIDRSNLESNTVVEEVAQNRNENISKLISKHFEFVEVSVNVTTDRFLTAAAQLCHMDTDLAEQVWLQLFPRLWDILDDQQRNALTQEILPFITSGTHIIQKDCHPSAVNTFVESLSRCNPPIQIAPALMKYVGKSHNLWHRMALGLEQMASDPTIIFKSNNPAACYDFEPDQSLKSEILDSLGELYYLLREEDLWAGLWQKHAYYKETNIAIAYEQHGFYEQAQIAYETAMAKHKQDNTMGPLSSNTQREVHLWTDHWMRCAKELNQWDVLLEYSKNGVYDPYLVLESSWRIPAWDVMKEALANVEYNCPKELAWKVTLYGGFLLICNPEEKPLKFAERYVETATMMCLSEWRRLPHVVSHIHLPFLQAAQQVMELQEAYQIHKGLMQGHQNSLHDMKAIFKTWRNRLPVIADDLTHWNDIFTWRQHHYQFIVNHYENLRESSHTNSMLGVHASAQSIIYFGKVARKHRLTNVCLDSLNKIYTITSVPIVDCFQKIRQQVKCYLQMASLTNKNELQEGLEVINNTNVKYFTKEMTAEFYALKGMLYHLSSE
ncbi:hypothetical protein FQR65_LT11955 [Abscondita terminalis]|nr:hypothetical protein FQR65_LT11955 [Abscondita terminalis]